LDSTARNGKEIPSLVQTLASGSDDAGHHKVDGGSNPARENNLNQQDYCFNQNGTCYTARFGLYLLCFMQYIQSSICFEII